MSPYDEEIQQYIDEMQQFDHDPYINLALSILIGDENAIDLQLVRIQNTGTDYIKAIEYSQSDAETLFVAATHSTDRATQVQAALAFLKDCQALYSATEASKMDQSATEANVAETHVVDVDVHRPQSEGSSTPEEAASSQPTSLEDDDEKSMPIPNTFNPDENKNTIYKKTKRFLDKIQVNDEKITTEITDNYFDLQINTARNHRREAQLQAKSLRQRLLEITQGQYADEIAKFIGDLMRTTSLDFQHQLRVSLLHEVDLVLRGADDENTSNTEKETKESEIAVPPEAPTGETDEATGVPNAAETSEASLSFHAPLPDLIERALNRLGTNMFPFNRERIYQLMVIGFIPDYVIKAIAEAADISSYPGIIEDYLSLSQESQ
ncbi:hypothetical protein GCM10023116_24180 [Kistimonas scapharcae]|uniref:Uncharacterized protein n=1 Tax=Kistimonas scapharcae TaxID=1036133 RepID=A0ABP8V4Y5_9GAMM